MPAVSFGVSSKDKKTLFPIARLAERVYAEYGGHLVHHDRGWNWHRKGLYGVHLKAIRVGRKLFTNLEFYEEFEAKVSEVLDGNPEKVVEQKVCA